MKVGIGYSLNPAINCFLTWDKLDNSYNFFLYFQGVDESIKLLQNSGVKVCMITGDGQATATAIATMLGRGCQLYINEPHLFPKRPQFCKLVAQLVKINSMGFILHIFTTWHPKLVELGTFCDTKSYN